MVDLKIVQNVEVSDMIDFVRRKGKLHQKLILDGLEVLLGKDSPEFAAARKLVLDNTNEFTRSVIRGIFGDSFEN